MSYILEALKKSDQQRQRGAAPTLQAAQVSVAAPRQPAFMHYGLLAVILLAVGIVIGWLRPWQTEHPAPATKSGVAESLIQPAPQNTQAAFSEPPEMNRMAAQELSATNATPVAQPVGPVSRQAEIPASAGATASLPEKPADNAVVAQEQKPISFADLPVQIQQEIPPLTIQLHAYAGNPAERLVSINSKRLREGDSLSPGLRLDQITPDGVVFSYKGYLFRRGIR